MFNTSLEIAVLKRNSQVWIKKEENSKLKKIIQGHECLLDDRIVYVLSKIVQLFFLVSLLFLYFWLRLYNLENKSAPKRTHVFFEWKGQGHMRRERESPFPPSGPSFQSQPFTKHLIPASQELVRMITFPVGAESHMSLQESVPFATAYYSLICTEFGG